LLPTPTKPFLFKREVCVSASCQTLSEVLVRLQPAFER
jgi:hypothetical protein